jgi:hypothetical protein
MQFFKFLFGLLLLEMATFAFVLLSYEDMSVLGILRLVLPLFIMAVGIALWFSSMFKESFASEREKLRVTAEKEKRAVEKEAQKHIIKEATSTHAKANFKVGMAFAGALGVGVLFVFAQMVTVGLLALSATGGVMGGYYWRGKRLENQQFKALEKENTMNIVDVKEITSRENML